MMSADCDDFMRVTVVLEVRAVGDEIILRVGSFCCDSVSLFRNY